MKKGLLFALIFAFTATAAPQSADLQEPPSLKMLDPSRLRARDELSARKERVVRDFLLDNDKTKTKSSKEGDATVDKYKMNYVPTFKFNVTAGGGAELLADATYPTPDASNPNERFPLIIFPNSWGVPHIEYVLKILQMATTGYVCVEYQTRGWYSATGLINTAGPYDRNDGSELVSLILSKYKDAWRVDETKIAFAGISYGGGISLMMAGHDSRIKTALVLSGWANLTESMYENDSPSKHSLDMLISSATAVGKPPPELFDLRRSLLEHKNLSTVISYGNERSAEMYLPVFKQKNIPLFIAHGYLDRFFSPQGLTRFWKKLEVEHKFLLLSHGPHAFPEIPGLFNLNNYVWAKGLEWLDAVLKGVPNGILKGPRVHMQLGNSMFATDYILSKDPPPPYVSTVLGLAPRGEGELASSLTATSSTPLGAVRGNEKSSYVAEHYSTNPTFSQKAALLGAERGMRALAKAGILTDDMEPHKIHMALTENIAMLTAFTPEGEDDAVAAESAGKRGLAPAGFAAVEEEGGQRLGECSPIRSVMKKSPTSAASNTIVFSKNVTLNRGTDLWRSIGIPSKTKLNTVSPKDTLIFTSLPLELPGRLCGFPELRNIKIRPTKAGGSVTSSDFQLYFYLYDVDNSCTGSILSDGVFTRWFDGDGPTVDPSNSYYVIPSLQMRAICTTVPAKHRVALGVTLYSEHFQPATEDLQVTFDYGESPALHLPFV